MASFLPRVQDTARDTERFRAPRSALRSGCGFGVLLACDSPRLLDVEKHRAAHLRQEKDAMLYNILS